MEVACLRDWIGWRVYLLKKGTWRNKTGNTILSLSLKFHKRYDYVIIILARNKGCLGHSAS